MGDLLAQASVLALLLLSLQFRKHLLDFTDGNVERLIREKRLGAVHAARARATLALMQKERVA